MNLRIKVIYIFLWIVVFNIEDEDFEDPEKISREIDEQFKKYPELGGEACPRENILAQILFDISSIATPYWQDVYRMCCVSTMLALVMGCFIWGVDIVIQMILKPIMFDGKFFW